MVFHRLFQNYGEGKGENDPFADDDTDEDTHFPSNISPRDQFLDASTGMFCNKNNDDNINMSVKNNERASLNLEGIDQLRSKQKRKKGSRVSSRHLCQKIKRKGVNDPLADDTTDEDASIPSNIKPIDTITEDTSEEDLLPKRKKRGRPRKVDACPSNDAIMKYFKSAK